MNTTFVNGKTFELGYTSVQKAKALAVPRNSVRAATKHIVDIVVGVVERSDPTRARIQVVLTAESARVGSSTAAAATVMAFGSKRKGELGGLGDGKERKEEEDVAEHGWIGLCLFFLGILFCARRKISKKCRSHTNGPTTYNTKQERVEA